MTDKVFLDSNVAIYALDAESKKGRVALSFLRDVPRSAHK